jgi:hypothetical protein
MQPLFVGILIVAWALQIAWIARAANDHGRSVLFWATLGGALGVAGVFLSKELIVANADPFGGNERLIATVLSPAAFLVLPMAGVAIALSRAPARSGRRRAWKVHEAKRGGGTLTIAGDHFQLEWPDGSYRVAFADLKKCEPDGECIRLAWAETDQVLMPMEKPNTRPGRQAQSRALAAQLDEGRTRAHPQARRPQC